MSEEKYTKLEQNRLEKIFDLRERGIEPFPQRVERTHNSQQAVEALETWEHNPNADQVRATMVGRLRSMRPMGKLVGAGPMALRHTPSGQKTRTPCHCSAYSRT